MLRTLPSWPYRFRGCSPSLLSRPPRRWDFHDLSPSHPGADTRVLEVSRL